MAKFVRNVRIPEIDEYLNDSMILQYKHEDDVEEVVLPTVGRRLRKPDLETRRTHRSEARERDLENRAKKKSRYESCFPRQGKDLPRNISDVQVDDLTGEQWFFYRSVLIRRDRLPVRRSLAEFEERQREYA